MCYESPTKNVLGSNKCIWRVPYIYETTKKLIQAILCRKGELLSRGPLSLNHSRSEIASEKHPSLIVYRRFLFISFFRWFPQLALFPFAYFAIDVAAIEIVAMLNLLIWSASKTKKKIFQLDTQNELGLNDVIPRKKTV